MAVEMFFRTSEGKYYDTIEKAEEAEAYFIKYGKMKSYFETLFDYFKIADTSDGTCVMYSLDDIAVHLINHFEDIKKIIETDDE